MFSKRSPREKHPRFEFAPRDDRSSKNEPKRVENDRDTSLQSWKSLTLFLPRYYPDARCNKAFPFHANSSVDLGISAAFVPGAEGEYDSGDVMRDEDNGVDLDTGSPTARAFSANAHDGANINYAVSRRSVFHRISTAGGKTARLMRTMSKISADLDRALLDLQGEIECDVDH